MSINPDVVRQLVQIAKDFSLGRLQVDGVDIYTTPSTFATPQPQPAESSPSRGVYDNLDDILSDPDLYLNER